MKKKNRHVLLLSDNCPSHLKFNQDDYPNVRVVFFPPKMTSHIQPMDAGIIHAFKAHYHSSFISCAINFYDTGITLSDVYKIDQLTAMKLANQAWKCLDQSVFVNCWWKTGILGPNVRVNQSEDLVEILDEGQSDAGRVIKDLEDCLLNNLDDLQH